MIRPGSIEQRPTLAPTLPADSEAVRRLLVPVPDPETALPALTRRVWQLAEEMGVRVTFFALCHDPAQESSLRRRLVMMAAMASSGRVRAEAEVIFGRDWAEAVRSRLQPGDMLLTMGAGNIFRLGEEVLARLGRE